MKSYLPGIIIYGSQYGTTKCYAEKLSEKTGIAMMTLLYNKVKNIPEEKKSAEDKAMIETFGKKVDFIDFDYLNPIIDINYLEGK